MPHSTPPSPARRFVLWGVACATSLLVSCPSSGDSGPKLERPNIVLVTIDTLRADHLGCYGYFRDTTPHIDAIAKESVVFDAAYATMATTLPSHASMMTARYPLEHGILANLMHGGKPFGWKQGMLSFAQVAKDAGYVTAGFVSSAPLKSQSGIGVGFDTWSEPALEQSERKAGQTLAEVLPWLEQAPREPFFLWVHLFDPHWPHRAPPPFDTQFQKDGPDPELEAWIAARKIGESAVRSNAKKTTETRAALNNYCAEVAYTDSQVGVLLDALRAKGLLERSILTITADHGEGLNQHDWTAHGLVWEEQLRVPLIMRFPAAARQAPRRIASIVSLIDLMPTMLGRVEPWPTPSWKQFFAVATGVDALDPSFEERPVYAQRTGREMERDPGEMFALTTRDWKYIDEPEVGRMLFDRRKDPFELENLYQREPQAAEGVQRLTLLMRELQSKRGAALGEAQAGALDPKVLKAIRDLGYMGGDDGRNGEGGARPPHESPAEGVAPSPASSENERDAQRKP
ncbi:MAG: sulfatase-like hydrolase/transferase [Planctomycetes bacterium]|nr:sulfatase-like hydrolase/transferase [Planctomycetota bacterium]